MHAPNDKGKVKVRHIIEADSALLKAPGGNISTKTSIFYEAYRNDLFVIDYETGELKNFKFDVGNGKYTNEYITCDPDGNMLVQMSKFDASDGTSLPNKMYYVNYVDLKHNETLKIS